MKFAEKLRNWCCVGDATKKIWNNQRGDADVVVFTSLGTIILVIIFVIGGCAGCLDTCTCGLFSCVCSACGNCSSCCYCGAWN